MGVWTNALTLRNSLTSEARAYQGYYGAGRNTKVNGNYPNIPKAHLGSNIVGTYIIPNLNTLKGKKIEYINIRINVGGGKSGERDVYICSPDFASNFTWGRGNQYINASANNYTSLYNAIVNVINNGGSSYTFYTDKTDTDTYFRWNSGDSNAYTANYFSTTDCSVTIEYKDAYTITLNANGGSVSPATIVVEQGDSATLPIPSYTGRDFQGWATSASASSGVTGSYTPNGNVTLYAIWKLKTYTVSYNANGGTGAPGAQTKTYGVNLTLSSTKPTKPDSVSQSNSTITITYNANKGSSTPANGTGTKTVTTTTPYEFTSWNTNSNGTGNSYSSGGTYNVNADVTLYAQYTAGTASTSTTNPSIKTAPKIDRADSSAGSYTVTFDANGGTCSTSTESASRTTSYSFEGWNTNTSGTGTNYSANTSYSFSASDTLYAKWSSSTSTASITLPVATRAGYTFKGWSTNSAATSGSTGSYTPTGNETLYAIWDEKTYYVYYKQGLASSTTNLPSTTSRKYTANATIATNNMSKDSTTANSYTVTYYKGTASSTANLPSKQTSVNTTTYTKNGWTTGSTNTNDRDYANGASYGANTENNLTLYPNFTTNTTNGGVTLSSKTMSKDDTTSPGYTVTYNKGTSTGGSLPANQTATDTLAYTHEGWAKTSEGSKAYDKGASTGALSSNLDLYPYFSSNRTRGSVTLGTNNMTKTDTIDATYTVTFNANEGSVSPTSATADKIITYTKNGWTTTSGNTSRTYANGATVQVTGNINLYPCFSQSTSTESITLPTPTRNGYTFRWWGASSTASSGSIDSYTPTGDTTLYAVWGQNVSITQQPQNVTVTVGATASTSVTAVGDGLTYQWYYKDVGSTSWGSSSIKISTYSIAMNSSSRIGRQIYCVITDAYGNTATSNTITLNATYQIVYNANGGTGTMSNSTHNCRVTKALTANTFTRDGYNFIGWATSSTATTAKYADKESVIGLTYDKSSITLYAVWEVANFITTVTRYISDSASGAKECEVYYYNGTKWIPIEEIWYYTSPTQKIQVGEQIPYIEP